MEIYFFQIKLIEHNLNVSKYVCIQPMQTCMNFFTLTEFKTEMWEKGCILLLIARLNFLFETSFHVFSTSHVIYLNTHSAVGHNIAKNRNKLFDANTMCIKS